MRSARLFYETSERARRIIESYFVLNSTLHFSYTHLVCRTAIKGLQLMPKPVFSKGNKMLPFTPMISNIQEDGWLLRLPSHEKQCRHFSVRSARSQEWPEPSHPCWQLLVGPWCQWVLEGTSSLHKQRLQVRGLSRLTCLWGLFYTVRRSCFNVLLCFSALLYLNADFEGGEFIFTEMDAKTVTVRSLPSKDDFIAFICFASKHVYL